ncbi:MAG: FGGY-family carbohydrate kinase [Alphaproteobacteria bacterium]
MMKYAIGVDVGTTSARAALFDLNGKKYAEAEQKIKRFGPKPDFIEQSSDDIWQSICLVVNKIIDDSRINKEQITGIGFDATCSLVALDKNAQPASVSPTYNAEQNVILWMDHRAIKQANAINQGNYEVLNYVGGEISPEMEIPKILWLKQNAPDLYENIRYFIDLPDFLTFKATGKFTRSACSTTCKWTYLNHENSWSMPFFEALDLVDLVSEDKIGSHITQVGENIGTLSPIAAAELGLHEGVHVCSSMIDAHAGGVGVLGEDLEGTLALITGTSACHMLCTKDKNMVPGIWGPYFGAMLPGLWLMEGGQSTAGALVEHLIKESSQYAKLKEDAEQKNCSIYQILNTHIAELEKDNPYLTADYHILGYFLGNRSPLADPTLKGSIVGLSLHDDNRDALAIRYLAALQAVAYGTRHIIEQLKDNGCMVNKIRMCGGGTKNPLWLREHANITGLNIEVITESEAMLLGSALLAAYAAGEFAALPDAMRAMSSVETTIEPQTQTQAFHNKKYKVFRKLYADFISYREIMGNDI